MRLILTGGGTGGHIYPLVAVYDEIKKATSLEVLYIGKKGGMEEGIAAKNGLDFFGLEIVGMNRGKPWQLFRLALLYCRAVYKSIAKIRSFKPDIIFATGGYACFPACFAAIILRIPFCLHEQNALPGKANLFLARFAFKTFVSFSSSLRKFRTKRPVILTGLPVRDVFFNCSTQKTREILGFSSSDRVILITGGSRGAGFLNALGEILVGWAKCNNKIVLITGNNNYDQVLARMEAQNIQYGQETNVTIAAYADNLDQYMSAADLIICRAGATTIGELCALGKPSVLVPYPSAAENHQLVNAQALEAVGAAIVFEENCFIDGASFFSFIEELVSDSAKLQKMGEHAKKIANCESAAKIANELIKIAK